MHTPEEEILGTRVLAETLGIPVQAEFQVIPDKMELPLHLVILECLDLAECLEWLAHKDNRVLVDILGLVLTVVDGDIQVILECLDFQVILHIPVILEWKGHIQLRDILECKGCKVFLDIPDILEH